MGMSTEKEWVTPPYQPASAVDVANRPSANGGTNKVTRITRKGLWQVAIGEEDPPFTVDAIAVWDEWSQVDASHRPDGKTIPDDQSVAWAESRRAFVQAIVAQGYIQVGTAAPTLTQAEVGEFIARLRDKVEELRSFFEPLTPKPPSSPAKTETRFSQ